MKNTELTLIEQYLIPGISGRINIYETDEKKYNSNLVLSLFNKKIEIFKGCKTRDCARRVSECYMRTEYPLELAKIGILFPNKAGWIKQFQICPTKKKNKNKIK